MHHYHHHHHRLRNLNRTALALLTTFLLLASGPQAAQAAEHFCGQRTAHPIDKALGAASERSGGVTVDLIDAQNAAYARVGQGAEPHLRPGTQGRGPRPARHPAGRPARLARV